MYRNTISNQRLADSVIAVPPLARNASGAIDREQNRRIVQHLQSGGVSTLLYGGNAALYHLAPSQYATLLEHLVEIVGPITLVIPSVGPAYGLMMDQAEILRGFDFPTVMVLPQRDIATPAGVECGIRQFADAFGKPVVLYIKHDGYLEVDQVRRMMDDGLISWIKYAVVRDDPANDDYLRALVGAVDPARIISGIGEQPAVIHMRDFGLAGFTSGCVCIAPKLSMRLLRSLRSEDIPQADRIRRQFRPLEDLRNEIHPIRVLHRAVELAGIADTGPMIPLLSDVDDRDRPAIERAAKELLKTEEGLSL